MMNNDIKLCAYGCGKIAQFQLKNDKWCCSKHSNSCINVRSKNACGVKKSHADGKMSLKWLEGKRGWAKGLTKETNVSVNKVSKTLKKKYDNGTLIPYFLGKHLSAEHRNKLRHCGGYRRCAGRGKSGWYKGYWCDSSWELAWVIYNLDHNIEFKRNNKGFNYMFDNKQYKFYPDFVMPDNSYVEIKGWYDDKNYAKITAFKYKLKIIFGKDIAPYLNYAIAKYGENFISLYDKKGDVPQLAEGAR